MQEARLAAIREAVDVSIEVKARPDGRQTDMLLSANPAQMSEKRSWQVSNLLVSRIAFFVQEFDVPTAYLGHPSACKIVSYSTRPEQMLTSAVQVPAESGTGEPEERESTPNVARDGSYTS